MTSSNNATPGSSPSVSPIQQAGDSLVEMNAWLLESLGMLDALLKTLQTDVVLDQKPGDIFGLAAPILKRALPFRAIAFYSVNAANMQFEQALVEPVADAERVTLEVEHYIDEGTFGWALYQNHPVIVPAIGGGSLLFHVMATRAAVIGMFVGLLPDTQPFIPDTVQKLLSIILLNCANAMETAALQNELKNSNRDLEKAVVDRTAELIKSKDEEQAANRAKSAFLANMSHEIRTPLSAIIGFTGLLEKTALDEKQREHVRALKVSSQSLMALINDVLDFSKIEAGKMDIIAGDFDLMQLCSDVLSMVRLKANQKGTALRLDFDQNICRFVRTDPVRLRQILINLVGNAEKFTERGEVALVVTLLAVNSGSYALRFAVRDTGIGISPESVGKLFSSFTQVDPSSTRRFGGTGLGLSISNKLVGLLGGERIRVESELGRGSRFWFDLELSFAEGEILQPKSASREAACAAPVPGAGGSYKILVVDDVPLNVKLATEILTAAGHTVVGAENGEQALELLQHNGFDAVLMDIQMPVMDGLEATRRIRKMHIATPVIAVTANALEEDRRRCFKVGMNAYVTKPIDVDVVIAAIREACGGKVLSPVLHERTWNNPETYPVDLNAALSRIGNNRKLFKELMQCLIDDVPSYVANLNRAVNTQNGDELRREAHKIKGAAAALSAEAIKDLAHQIELKGFNNNFAQTKDLLVEIETEFEELKSYYASFAV